MLQTVSKFAWTDENIAYLRERYTAGDTAAKIALTLGPDVSRNSVIGKIHRLGLNRGAARSSNDQPKKKVAAAGPKPVTKPVRAAATPPENPDPVPVRASAPPAADPPGADGLTIFDLESHHCRFPFGDKPPYRYCGARKTEGFFWFCQAHAAVALVPQNRREPSEMRKLVAVAK